MVPPAPHEAFAGMTLEAAKVVVVGERAVHVDAGPADLINQSAFEGLEEFFGSYERL